MGLGDAEEGTGGAFGAAMALLPILEGAGTDADEGGELVLTEAELLAHGLGIRCLQGGAAGGFVFSAKDGTAFLEAGGELLEEFVFHGNSVSMMDLRILSWAAAATANEIAAFGIRHERPLQGVQLLIGQKFACLPGEE